MKRKLLLFFVMIIISQIIMLKSLPAIYEGNTNTVKEDFFLYSLKNFNYSRAIDIVQTSDRGYVLLGHNFTSDSAVLLKTDKFGEEQWLSTIEIPYKYDTLFSCLIQTADGFLIIGFTDIHGSMDYEFLVIKADILGNLLWNKTYGIGMGWDNGYSGIKTMDNGFAVLGFTDNLHPTNNKTLLFKLDSEGNVEWNQTYDGEPNLGSQLLIQDSFGEYYIGNTLVNNDEYDFQLIKTSSLGEVLWNKTYKLSERDWLCTILETSDDGLLLVGSTYTFNIGETDLWVVKTDQEGNPQWNKTFGDAILEERPLDVTETVNGCFALLGCTSGLDFTNFVLHIDDHGDHQWNITISESDGDEYQSIIGTVEKRLALAGQNNWKSSLLLIKKDPDYSPPVVNLVNLVNNTDIDLESTTEIELHFSEPETIIDTILYEWNANPSNNSNQLTVTDPGKIPVPAQLGEQKVNFFVNNSDGIYQFYKFKFNLVDQLTPLETSSESYTASNSNTQITIGFEIMLLMISLFMITNLQRKRSNRQ